MVNFYSKNLLEETAAKFLQSASFIVRVCNHYLQSKKINLWLRWSFYINKMKKPNTFENKWPPTYGLSFSWIFTSSNYGSYLLQQIITSLI